MVIGSDESKKEKYMRECTYYCGMQYACALCNAKMSSCIIVKL